MTKVSESISKMSDCSFDSPQRLLDISIDFITERLSEISFPQHEVYFHTELSEQILETFSKKKKLTDTVLRFFDIHLTHLKHVRLKDASKLTLESIKTLGNHKILDLEILGVTKVNIPTIIFFLNDWTKEHLQSLNVSKCNFNTTEINELYLFQCFYPLRHLRTLNLSNTNLNTHSFVIFITDLISLENLDISSTLVDNISCLTIARKRLRSLSIFGLKLTQDPWEFNSVLSECRELRYLDISEDRDEYAFDIFLPNPRRIGINDLLLNSDAFPHLNYLDISGRDEILISDLKFFLNRHSQLSFLGLVLTDICRDEYFTHSNSSSSSNKKLVISGNANEEQVLEALKSYSNRPYYVQKSLYHLFRITQGYTTPRTDIIHLVLEAARNYQSDFSIQMAATACLFNLSKSDLGQKIHPKILSMIVEVDLNAMEAFPQHRQLQKNVLLTICNDRILTEVNFNKYRCAKLVMDCLCSWTDHSMNRMSVAICSILAARISTTQSSELGSHSNYMRKLLSIVEGRMNDLNIDITMKFTLSALWNLTDESPKTSRVFLSEGGMRLFIQVLEKFPGNLSIETKILGLLNNIAEVKGLRSSLMVDSFISILRKCLHSSHIDVSYFAAGIVAHLASDGANSWTNTSVSIDEMTHDLLIVVMNWMTPKDEMVAYRSFKPFFPLMTLEQKHAVQLWAVWAIHHVLSKNARRYCAMLKQQGGDTVIITLMRFSVGVGGSSLVHKLCEQIMDTMVKNGYYTEDNSMTESSQWQQQHHHHHFP